MEKKDFIKDIDYYLEDGFVIFTESYLREKGECCGNNCRHCPYEKPVIKGNKMPELRHADGTYGSWGTSGNDNKR